MKQLFNSEELVTIEKHLLNLRAVYYENLATLKKMSDIISEADYDKEADYYITEIENIEATINKIDANKK